MRNNMNVRCENTEKPWESMAYNKDFITAPKH
jgi:hypothetical protein